MTPNSSSGLATRLAAALSLMLLFTSCMEVIHESGPSDTQNSELNISDHFDFSTTREATLTIRTQDNKGVGLHNVPLTVTYKYEGNDVVLANLVSNQNGTASFQNVVPEWVDTLQVTTTYPGLANLVKVPVGSKEVLLGGVPKKSMVSSWLEQRETSLGRTEALSFKVKGKFDNQGVPQYLEPVKDYIPQDLLDLVNATLPETKPVPTNNPSYISSNINPDTRLKEKADVYITFVHEGAGYMNSLGYYTYPVDNPPKTIADIKDMTILFPNLSLPGSGGNLSPGSKVFVGTFEANTAIGWFLIPNGWTGSQVVERADVKFSTKILNTFTAETYRQHVVQLKDAQREILLLGMEDLSRPSGDNDFNDAVFFVTANPYTAVITDNMPETKQPTGTDTDKDGVLDKNDKYPNDPEKAFEVFTPGENIYGSLAFEDQWPAKGDYDVNDLVTDYNFQFITNTSNAAVECKASFIVKAAGATYRNGFGFELPIDPALIQSVTTTHPVTGKIVKLAANGTEANQKQAVIIVFEDAHALLGTDKFVNTRLEDPKVPYVTIQMTLKFASPVKLVDLGYAPFNAFIFVNGNRSREVHRVDQPPTSLANLAELGTSADSSDPAKNRYYKSGNNLPWVIHLPVAFSYPRENRPIHETYLKFKDWSQSDGLLFKDWQLDKAGYRNGVNIYK